MQTCTNFSSPSISLVVLSFGGIETIFFLLSNEPENFLYLIPKHRQSKYIPPNISSVDGKKVRTQNKKKDG